MENSKWFPEIHGNFGFGCMRLPMKGGQVDYDEFSKMADAFIEAGFNYFDTAHGYIGGQSETAIRDCVSGRYDRSSFLHTNKLTDPYFKSQEEIRPFFEKQLKWCGVDYFDFYLMHAQDHNNYQKFKRCKAYETAYKFKEEGLIRHFGISFHDKADVLEMILSEHPEIVVVQIQFNYLDYEDATVEARKVYEVCEKYNKPVLVMEPVKGGSLVNLPEDADKILRDLNGGSNDDGILADSSDASKPAGSRSLSAASRNASYAIRFAASFPNIAVVLSGMSDMSQMADNISAMKDFMPLTKAEHEAVRKVCDIFKGLNLIPCTSCRYCIEESECPKGIRIPDLFAALNAHEAFHNWNTGYYYENIVTGNGHGRASDCIKCGKCERVCPQHLEIRNLLTKVAATFDH